MGGDGLGQALQAAEQVLAPTPLDLPTILFRLILAALLGMAISLRGKKRNEFTVVHTNMILAFSGAITMMIVGSDLARAFGLVGASSLVRYRTPVRDPQALASLFVAMGVGIAVGLGLIELAIIATILVILLEVALLRGGQLISHGWYHPERNYELELETEAAANTLVAVQKLLTEEHISYTLVEYESAKKTDAVRLGLNVGLPESADTEKLTLQLLAAGARSVSWRLAKD